jgi:hypothetical protein
MTIKAIIDATAFEALEEPMQGLYQQNTENKNYYLDLETGEADKLAFGLVGERDKLAANNKKLLDEKIQANARATEAERKAAELANTGNDTDVVDKETHTKELLALKQSFDDELANRDNEKQALYGALAETAQKSTVSQLVTEYNLDPEYAAHVLPDYIKAEVVDNNVFVNVYENGEKALVAGTPKTPKHLLEGFLANGKYKQMFLANNGGGGGANNNHRPAQNGLKSMKRSDFDKLSISDPVAARSFISEGGKPID